METIAEKRGFTKVVRPTNPVPVLPSGNKRQYLSLTWQAEQFESARFGWMAILLTLQSCVGAVACLFISMNPSDIVSLAVCAAVTMGSNAVFIALAPPKVCLIAFYISMVANTIMILLAQI